MAPMIEPDFTEQPPLEGTFNARITDCVQKTSAAGNAYLAWTFTLEDPAANGRKAWLNTTLSGYGAQLMKKVIQAVYPQYDGGPFDTDSLIGRAVAVNVGPGKNRDGSPSQYLNVSDVFPSNDVGFDEFPAGQTG